MFCDNCGCELNEDVKVCPVCGKIFTNTNNTDAIKAAINDYEEGTTVLKAEDEEEGTTILTSENPEEEGTTILTSGNPEEEGTTILTSGNPEEEGTTVLSSNNGPVPGRTPMRQNDMPIYQNGMPPINQNNIPQGKNDKKAKKEKKPRKQKKGGKIALVIVLVVLVLIIGAAAILIVPRVLNYNKAEEALNAGNVEEAVALYEDASPYKNSDEMANGGAYQEYAEVLFAEGNYLEAANYYGKASDLGYYADEGDVDNRSICYYSYAEQLYSAENYLEAVTYYEMVADYDDSVEKIIECYYNAADEKFDAGEYEEAYDLYLQSQASDGQEKANECLYLLAGQYTESGDYENAITTYEQLSSEGNDYTSDIDSVYKAWGDALVDEGDYVNAIEKYLLVVNEKVTKRINKAKAGYVESHFDISDEMTMTYLCELKYADFGTASEDYVKLVGWDVESFVNYSKKNTDNKKKSVKSEKDIYIHTLFSNENDSTLNVKGYVVYSDGSKSNEVTLGEVHSGDASWLSIPASQATTGETTLYIYDVDSGNLIEKYTFDIN